MTAIQVRIRDGVYSRINSNLLSYPITDFNLEKTYYPQENLEALGDKPFVKVVSLNLAAERNRQLRDANKVLLRTAVQIAVQQRIAPTDLVGIDRLVELVEAIMADVEDDELVPTEDFQWVMTDPLRDENGIIYNYEQLKMQGVFNSIFAVHYHFIRQ